MNVINQKLQAIVAKNECHRSKNRRLSSKKCKLPSKTKNRTKKMQTIDQKWKVIDQKLQVIDKKCKASIKKCKPPLLYYSFDFEASVRITAELFTTLILSALILYVSGLKFLRNIFMAGLFTLRVFAWNMLRKNRQRKYFFSYSLLMPNLGYEPWLYV